MRESSQTTRTNETRLVLEESAYVLLTRTGQLMSASSELLSDADERLRRAFETGVPLPPALDEELNETPSKQQTDEELASSRQL
jgi:hypothetical protein